MMTQSVLWVCGFVFNLNSIDYVLLFFVSYFLKMRACYNFMTIFIVSSFISG